MFKQSNIVLPFSVFPLPCGLCLPWLEVFFDLWAN
jgi:hypothetical protein